MALIPVAPPKQKVQSSGGSQGGGLKGQGLGALLGAGAVIASGGTAAPAILGGAATGASLGGLAGSLAQPASAPRETFQAGPSQMSLVQLGSASGKIYASLQALEQMPVAIQQEYSKPLTEAYIASQIALKNHNTLGGGGLA